MKVLVTIICLTVFGGVSCCAGGLTVHLTGENFHLEDSFSRGQKMKVIFHNTDNESKRIVVPDSHSGRLCYSLEFKYLDKKKTVNLSPISHGATTGGGLPSEIDIKPGGYHVIELVYDHRVWDLSSLVQGGAKMSLIYFCGDNGKKLGLDEGLTVVKKRSSPYRVSVKP